MIYENIKFIKERFKFITYLDLLKFLNLSIFFNIRVLNLTLTLFSKNSKLSTLRKIEITKTTIDCVINSIL